jgi:hypothetical protein
MGVAFWPGAVLASQDETIQRATDAAIGRIVGDLQRTSFPKIKNVAVVPLRGDRDDYATSGLKSALTKTSYHLFSRSDEEWDKLLTEIEWGVRREDIMDPATVQKFGRIKGVDAVMFGQVWDRDVNMWSIRGHTKLSVSLAEVETGQILWSSGPVDGEAYMHWSDALTQFWRYPMMLLVVAISLGVCLLLIRWVMHLVVRASRPL